jgi:hypothetical protein
MASASISKMHLTKSTTRTTMTAPRNIEVGRGNPFSNGDNTPQSLAVFLCLSVFDRPNLGSRFNIMMGLFGQSLRLVVPLRGISTPCNSVTNTVESIGVGYPTFSNGNHQ